MPGDSRNNVASLGTVVIVRYEPPFVGVEN